MFRIPINNIPGCEILSREYPLMHIRYLIHTEVHKLWKQRRYYCYKRYRRLTTDNQDLFEKAVINIASELPKEELDNLVLSEKTLHKIRGIRALNKLML